MTGPNQCQQRSGV